MGVPRGSYWEALPGIGVRLSDVNVPVPDLLVRPNDDLTGVECDDMLIAFEILSPSTANRDLCWKLKAYATLPSLLHYIVIAQDAIDVVSFDRNNQFAERRFELADGELVLAVIGVQLALREIYRDTALA
jgi:Uma2 family endonuclease